MSVKVINRNGKAVTLLNPAEKGRKYAHELRTGHKFTNDGVLKKDGKGKAIPLSDSDKKYRCGYLNSRKDGAGAWKSAKAKKNAERAARKNGGKK